MERFASTVVGQGDRISLDLANFSDSLIKFEDPARVLYEDETILIYDKPPGVNCDQGGVVERLKKGRPSIQLAHRLDRETTGVLVFAKTRAAYEALLDQFKKRHVNKKYLAVVDGFVPSPRGRIKNRLGKLREWAGQAIWGAVKPPKGLSAVTDWERLKWSSSASLLICYPKTGRTHQIRAHLAGMGHPILGDFQYGKDFQCVYKPPRILLHAEEICFLHPLTNQETRCSAPIPSDMAAAIQELFEPQGFQ